LFVTFDVNDKVMIVVSAWGKSCVYVGEEVKFSIEMLASDRKELFVDTTESSEGCLGFDVRVGGAEVEYVGEYFGRE